MSNAIVVLTVEGTAAILSAGGSQAWRLNVGHARKSEFLVCVQNGHKGQWGKTWGSPTEPHNTAFLIGRITEIVPSRIDLGRWLIKIGEYARISVPGVWQAWRYPVRYLSLEELEIDPAELTWEAMPDVAETPEPEEEIAPVHSAEIKALTIPEAKKGLALTFNVPPEAIEITIRG
jgi:hypothetical protein